MSESLRKYRQVGKQSLLQFEYECSYPVRISVAIERTDLSTKNEILTTKENWKALSICIHFVSIY